MKKQYVFDEKEVREEIRSGGLALGLTLRSDTVNSLRKRKQITFDREEVINDIRQTALRLGMGYNDDSVSSTPELEKIVKP